MVKEMLSFAHLLWRTYRLCSGDQRGASHREPDDQTPGDDDDDYGDDDDAGNRKPDNLSSVKAVNNLPGVVYF